MTIQSHYVAPPPLITRIDPLSSGYWQVVRGWKATRRAAKPVIHVLRLTFLFLFVILPIVLRNPTRWLLSHLARLARAIDRIADAILSAIAAFIIEALRALIKPMLVLLAILSSIIVAPKLRDLSPAPAPAATLAMTMPRATPPTRKRDALPDDAFVRLARFHAPYTFDNRQDAIDAMADALNIPVHVVNRDVPRALELAATNAAAMAAYAGHFPLPANTSRRLLAALTPADHVLLVRLMEHTTTVSKPQFKITTNQLSGNLSFAATVTALRSGTAQRCFRYAMDFARRAFRHTLTIAACRQGAAWTFLTTPAERNPS